MSSINLFELFRIILNTIIRLIPVAFYAGCMISGAIFNDFRAVLLLGGFVMNEFMAFGYRMIFNGVSNPDCAMLVTANNVPFVLPSPITQTIGYLLGFICADMYYNDSFNPIKFFGMIVIIIGSIYSRVNIGCKTLLDAIYCGIVGVMLGIIYYTLIKDMYRPDYFKLDVSVDDIDKKISEVFA